MSVSSDTLLLSTSNQSAPNAQRNLEKSLLARAREGETHLHLSTLHGQLLSLGAFQATFVDPGDRIWRRHTGGRAIAAGDGFLVLTLALPDRTALGEDLRPEQILNRGVRGLLHWLRSLGLDPVYPGLDFVTIRQQRLGHVSFVENASGALLLQAILAQTTSLSETMLRLDRIDPEGIVPALAWSPEDSVTLDRLGDHAAARMSPAAALGPLGAAYGDLLGLGVEVTNAGVLQNLAHPSDRTAPEPKQPRPHTMPVRTEGHLGPVLATMEVRRQRIDFLRLEGNLIGPDNLQELFIDALHGLPATTEAIQEAIDHLFADTSIYALGLDANKLKNLFCRALESAR